MELNGKQLLLLLLLVLPLGVMAQSVKKKYLGMYSGTIPAYTMVVGETTVTVASSTIRVLIAENFSCTQVIGNDQQSGKWKVVTQDKTSYTLEVRLENQQLLERFIIDKKTKSLQREGFFPQPDVVLLKEH
jgi:hypothetical protein